MGRLAIVPCVALAACSGPSDDTKWTTVLDSQPASLLSVWGTSATDVWTVGHDPRDGGGPTVLHYDGTVWHKLDTTVRNTDLWWLFGFAGGPIFMSGSNGTILKYEGGTFTKMQTPGTRIVFGLWGSSANDMWAVGGNFGGGGFAWQYDGNAQNQWVERTDVPADIASTGTLWKVNGLSSTDVWISCSLGATLHWDGSTLDRQDTGADAPLLSIAGNSERFITAGGQFDGVLFENSGSGWKTAIPAGGPRLVGAAMTAKTAYVVGETGTVLERGDDGKWSADTPRATNQNLHGVWIDPDEGGWAVGGHYDPPPGTDGALIYKGSAQIEGTIQ